MRMIILLVALAAGTLPAAEPPVTADEIMARVAENQELAEGARSAFVYRQKIAIRLRDTHGKLVREEISDYLVTPDAQRTRKELVTFSGRYWKNGSMIRYDKPGGGADEGFRYEADGNMAHHLRDGLAGDRKSKDGLAPGLFPLTAKEQVKYRFTMKGEENYQGGAAYRIAFKPKQKHDDVALWEGEVLVSKADCEPLMISTKLAWGVPFWVRTALGTNVPGMGFSVQYQKFDGGVWFPVSYGTEFGVHVLFVYSRHVGISIVNSEFRRAEVKSRVEFDTVQ